MNRSHSFAICSFRFAVVCVLAGFLSLSSRAQTSPTDASVSRQRQAEAVTGYGELPLAFEPNRGQAADGVRFAARAKGLAVLLQDREVSLSVPGADRGRPAQVRMTYVGANFAEAPVASEKQDGVSNYLLGKDAAKWHTGIANYGLVKYSGLYPGIDLVFYGNHRKLEHDFQVAAGADYRQIRVHLDGAKSVKLNSDGNLRVTTATGDMTFQAPKIYQMRDTAKEEVAGRYVVTAESEFGFEIDTYDKARALIIDPVLSYSTYLAGSATDVGDAIAVDTQGNAYITGYTLSTDFPVFNPEQAACNAPSCSYQDAFVTKLNPTGTGLIFSTFVGGTSGDQGNAIAVDSLGNVVVAGLTYSYDFPQMNGMTVVLNSYSQHGMAFSLTPAGSAFNFSTYLGGASQDSATGVAVDASGSVYLAGYTGSANFPLTAGHLIGSLPSGYNDDLFLVKLGRKGKLLFSTMVGGPPNASGNTFLNYPVAVGVDAKNEAVLAGTAFSGAPTTPGTFQPSCPGNTNSVTCVFIGRLNATGTTFVAATYLGGSGGDTGGPIHVNPDGTVFVAGGTTSSDFPTTPLAFQKTPPTFGYQAPFVTKLNPMLSKLTYSTYLAGTGAGGAYGAITVAGLAVDATGNAYVAGSTNNPSLPLVSPLISLLPVAQFGSSTAAFLSVLNPSGSSLTYSTLFSGSTSASAQGVAVDRASHALITGWTNDADLPTTAGAFQPTAPSSTVNYVQHAFVSEFLMSQANASACVNPTSVYLSSNYGKPSQLAPVTITNCGTVPLTITAMTVSNPVFTINRGLCTTLAAGASCTAHIRYTPAKGVYGDTGTIQIVDNAPISPQTVNVNGYVNFPGTGLYSYYTLGFGDVVLGVTSTPSFVTVQNYGSVPLHITSITASTGFTAVNHCPKALPAGSYCQIGATFTPTVTGLATGTLTVYDDAIDSPQTLGLAGNGLATYPAPSGLTLNPSYAPAGSAPVQVSLSGNYIYPTSQVTINGVPFAGKVTLTYSTLQFTLPAAMLKKMGSLAIQVVNPAPGGASLPVDFSVYGQTALPAVDMVFEPFTRKFYASIPASDTTNPNSLITVDPTTGAVGAPIPIGLDPGALGLSDDGTTLYVALNGENAIVPFDIATQTLGTKIPLGVDILKGPLTAADIQVQPGNSKTLIVTLAAGFNGNDGLALVVNGQIVSEYLNNAPNNVYVGGTKFVDATNVYGWDPAYNSYGILHFVIAGNLLLEAPGISTGYGVGAFATDGTTLFDVSGQVYSASSGLLVGTINGLGTYPSGPIGVLNDSSSGRLFFVEGPFNTATEVIDATTLNQVGFAGGPSGINSRVQKWGPDGLAYLSAPYPQMIADSLIQIRTSLFYPTLGPNPLPISNTLNPATATAASPNFVLTVTGSQFVPGAVVQWNGVARTTTYKDAQTLLADIPASDVAIAGSAKVRVVNPGPGGGISGVVTLPIF